jgi:hypothetical protein
MDGTNCVAMDVSVPGGAVGQPKLKAEQNGLEQTWIQNGQPDWEGVNEILESDILLRRKFGYRDTCNDLVAAEGTKPGLASWT